MRGIRRSTTDPEFDVAEIVVKAVETVIEAGVFRIRAFTPLAIGRKTSILVAVIIVLLWVPEFVVAHEVNRGADLLDLLMGRSHEWQQVGS